jgi:hypothetical protein
MVIQDHPFRLLGVNARTNRREILRRGEALALAGNADRIRAAADALTNPKKRIDAEVSWFPGVPPGYAEQLLQLIATDSSLAERFENLLASHDPLTRLNIVAYWLALNQQVTPTDLGAVLQQMNYAAAQLEAAEPDIFETINADRIAAGFPRIAELQLLHSALTNRIENLVGDLAGTIQRTPGHQALLASFLEDVTLHGLDQCSDFAYALIRRYQVLLQPIIQARGHTARLICGWITKAAGEGRRTLLAGLIGQLEVATEAWVKHVKPIQLAMKSQGLRECQSVELANAIRSVAVDLSNEQGFHEEARRITALLARNFEEVSELADRLGSDLKALDEIIECQREERRKQEERRKELELDIFIGRDRLRISAETVEYGSARIRTNEIQSLRWGVYRSYYNGIRTSREFTIWMKDTPRSQPLKIECVRFLEPEKTVSERFTTIIGKLWKAVGARIMIEMCTRLMDGGFVNIGRARITREGIWLAKHRWFKSEPYFARWEELRKHTQAGELHITSEREKASVSLAFRDVDNAVVLAELLDFLWKDGNAYKLRAGTLFQN